MLALAGCSAGPDGLEWELGANGGQAGYAGGALRQAQADFLGESARLPSPRQAGPASIIILDPGTAIAFEERSGGYFGVRAGAHHNIADDVAVKAELALGHAIHRAYLPQGLGVLTDPMAVTLTANVLSAELSVARRQSLPAGWQVDYGGGAGIALADADIHIRSSLIALKSETFQTLPYLLLSSELSNPSGVTVKGAVRIYSDKSVQFGLGFAKPF